MERAALVGDADRGKVHPRRADKTGDEAVGRFVVEVERLTDLLHQPVAHHHDAVAKRHCLDLIVRHVDRRGSEPVMELFQFDSHLHAQRGVEIGQRLVEQKYLRIAHDGAAERNALALAPGQLAWLALQQVLDAENVGRVAHPPLDFGAGKLAHLQAERHVVMHAHVRIERVVLKHHGDVAIHRRQVVDHSLTDQDVARGYGFQDRRPCATS